LQNFNSVELTPS